MDETLFTVVVPVYNKEKLISSCLDSILKQNKLPSKVIIINDGSTDNSIDIVNEYTRKAPALFDLIHQSNMGVSYARNTGLKLAKTKYVAFLDADDYWKPDFLEKMFFLIEKFPRASMFSSFHEIHDSDGNSYSPYTKYIDGFMGYIDYFKDSIKVPVINSSKVIVVRSHAILTGGFPEKVTLTEDLSFWFDMAIHYPVAHVNLNLVIVNQFQDISRSSRLGKVPHIVSRYESDPIAFDTLTVMQKKYLFSVFYKHVVGSLKNGSYNEAINRYVSGYRVLGWRALFCIYLFIIPPFFYKFLRAVRRKFRSFL